jgi:putative transposase
MPNHIHALFLLLNGQAPVWPEIKRGTASGSISSIVQAYKSTTSRLAKPLGFQNYWQRGFNDHIVRDEDDLFNVRRYIEENPRKWELDLDNPVNWKK